MPIKLSLIELGAAANGQSGADAVKNIIKTAQKWRNGAITGFGWPNIITRQTSSAVLLKLRSHWLRRIHHVSVLVPVRYYLTTIVLLKLRKCSPYWQICFLDVSTWELAERPRDRYLTSLCNAIAAYSNGAMTQKSN